MGIVAWTISERLIRLLYEIALPREKRKIVLSKNLSVFYIIRRSTLKIACYHSNPNGKHLEASSGL